MRRSLTLAADLFLEGRRRRLLEAEIAPALRLLADSIDSGLTIPAAAARVGEGGGLAARHLGELSNGCARGLTVSESLSRLSASRDGDLWAPTAFTIELHFRQGGDLPSSLRQVADQFEERRASKSGAQSATAQARFTANLVCAMPLLALAGAAVLFPGRVSLVGQRPLSLVLLILGLVLQAISLLVIRRISGGMK